MTAINPTGESTWLELAFQIIDQANKVMPPDAQIPHLASAPLAGDEGPLDSLGIVNLLSIAEDLVEQRTCGEVSLLSDGLSPEEFRPRLSTVGAFAELLQTTLASL